MCTGIRLIAKNGDVVYGRTMEFDNPLPLTVGYAPRGLSFRGTTPTGPDGMEWTNDYAYGGNLGQLKVGDVVVNGSIDLLNEHGLAAGVFNLPGFTVFPGVTDDNRSKMIASWEIASYVAGKYKTTAEARKGIAAGDFIVGATPFPMSGKTGQMPQHLRVGDASGETIVVEWHEADQPPTIYDCEAGNVANHPTFDFHLVNMRQFDHLSPYNPSGPFEAGSQAYKQTMGDGYMGLPGGSSSADRFVRASLYARDTYTGDDGEDTAWVAFNVLNNFDLPPGILRNVEASTNTEIAEYTQWLGVADTKNRTYYFRSHNDNGVYELDLTKQDPTGTTLLQDSRPSGINRRTIEVFTG
jgi:choloylglycine hydrolase